MERIDGHTLLERKLEAENAALRQSNERMKQALENMLIAPIMISPGSGYESVINKIVREARAALAGEKESSETTDQSKG